jgi:cell shape-determining protein MreC
MVRTNAHPPVRWSLPIVIGALMIASMLPVRTLGWARWFSDQTWVLVSPIAQPITMAINAVVPTRGEGGFSSERERELVDELERLRVRLRQAEQRGLELEDLANQLARGAALQPNIEVTQLQRPRISEGGDMLVIRTGTAEGVTAGTVVTSQSVQVIGRVADAAARTARVLPITARTAPSIAGFVVLDELSGRRASCRLKPAGDGTLTGEVSPPEDGRADELQVGQAVRLFDESWPRHAQMLIIGDVERIEPSPSQPLRRLITVRPRVDLRRVSEVILRLPARSDGGG